MYKIIMLMFVLLLNSCSQETILIKEKQPTIEEENNIEQQEYLNKNNQTNIVNQLNHKAKKTVEVEIENEDKIITQTKDNFEIENIEGDFTNKDFNLDNNFIYTQSGLSKRSSYAAKKAILINKNKNHNIDFVIYFAYDSTKLNKSSLDIIHSHQQFIQKNPTLKLRLEGHTDERGTREYNLSLGENRAIMVKKELLKRLKTLNTIIEIISFGEEKPIAKDFNKNRRVEFIYQ